MKRYTSVSRRADGTNDRLKDTPPTGISPSASLAVVASKNSDYSDYRMPNANSNRAPHAQACSAVGVC